MNNKIKLRVQGLTNSQIQSGAYALVLAESDGKRRIPIIVGTAEAQSIAIALEGIVPPRPLTHDLFASFAETFNINIKEVLIYKFEDGIFYSKLIFDEGGNECFLDSRTSDAIAIALRVKCDIYTTPAILEECGVVLEEVVKGKSSKEKSSNLADLEPEEIQDEITMKRWLALLEDEELQDRLEDAITDENYEFANMYKEEIQRRNKKETK